MSDSGQQPAGVTPAGAKAALRARLLAARQALPEPVRTAADRRLHAALPAALAAAAGPGPVTVAGYVPFGVEPGGAQLPAVLTRLLPAGGRLLLPVLLPDRSLDWAAYEGRLLPTHRGLAEPAGPRLGTAAIGQAALVLAPAVAVDRRGVRLGRGGGSYDRALALAGPRALVVAVLHAGELLDAPLPAEPHDQRVGAVLTPGQGLVRVGP